MKELAMLKANAEAAYTLWRSYDDLQPHSAIHDARREELQTKLTLAEHLRRQGQALRFGGH